MTADQANAARRLLAVLDGENAALRDRNYAGVAASTTAKQAALRALERCAPLAGEAGSAGTGNAEAAVPDATMLARALRDALDENRRLLRQGMEVQHRVMQAVAGAARRQAARDGYGASGAPARPATMSAVAIIARA